MKISNKIITIEISNHGAELKSAVKDGREYMWCGDSKYWGRTSPVLFPFVGSLRNKKYIYNGVEYPMGQHGFARDNEFTLVGSSDNSASFEFKSSEETKKIYPFDFTLNISYTINDSVIKVEWSVKNDGEKPMFFSIGAHPAFNLKEGTNYFAFDNKNDIAYNLIDESGLYDANNRHTLKNDGYVKIVNSMFDNDALIIENKQLKAVSLCGSDKKPYVTVKFDMPLAGLWSPAKKNAPFVCIEPWFGRCDRNDFCGEINERDYVIALNSGEEFNTQYEIELS